MFIVLLNMLSVRATDDLIDDSIIDEDLDNLKSMQSDLIDMDVILND